MIHETGRTVSQAVGTHFKGMNNNRSHRLHYNSFYSLLSYIFESTLNKWGDYIIDDTTLFKPVGDNRYFFNHSQITGLMKIANIHVAYNSRSRLYAIASAKSNFTFSLFFFCAGLEK